MRVYEALRLVAGYRLDDTDRAESKGVDAVEDEILDATIPQLKPAVADMVRFQRLTGARPCEVCNLQVGDIDRSGEVWIATQHEHKTRRHGRERKIYIGPKGQQLLAKRLLNSPTSYVFVPSSRSRRGRYTTDSYRQAIQRGCDRGKLKRWSPGQIRHTAASAIRAECSAEDAQVILGHANLRTTEIYAERSERRAIEVARRLG